MKHVVDEGTGTAAQIPGIQIAGKTGTAQTGRAGQLDAWFIAFAPAENPQVAVAVVVERTRRVRRPGRRSDRPRRDAGGAECRFVKPNCALRAAGCAAVPWKNDPMTGDDTQPGQPFDGRYRVLGRLGVGRHGDGLPGRGFEPRPQGRAQGHGGALRRGRRVRRALPPRGAGRRAPQPSEHHRRLRPRRGRRPAVHRDGVPPGPHAQAGHPEGRAAAARARDRGRACRCSRACATPTSTASCTATSSRTTCSSATTAASRSPTSGSRTPATRR